MNRHLKTIKTGLAHNKPMTATLLGFIGCFGLVEILREDIIGLFVVATMGLVSVALHIRCALLEQNWSQK